MKLSPSISLLLTLSTLTIPAAVVNGVDGGTIILNGVEQGGFNTAGLLTTNSFADSATVTWFNTNGVLSAAATNESDPVAMMWIRTNGVARGSNNTFIGVNTFNNDVVATKTTRVAILRGGWNLTESTPASNSIAIGGQANYIAGSFNTLVGGYQNHMAAYGASTYNFLGAGYLNIVEVGSIGGVVVGGVQNELRPNTGGVNGPQYSVISGGQQNRIYCQSTHNVISGGGVNMIGADNVSGISAYNIIAGGYGNHITNGYSASAFGGRHRIFRSTNAVAIGYSCTISNATGSFVLGQYARVTNSGVVAIMSSGSPITNGPLETSMIYLATPKAVIGNHATNTTQNNQLRVAGSFGIANAFAGVLTSGVCIVTLPTAQPDTTYVPMCIWLDSIATNSLNVTNLTTTNFEVRAAAGDSSRAFLGIAIDR